MLDLKSNSAQILKWFTPLISMKIDAKMMGYFDHIIKLTPSKRKEKKVWCMF
jgi:hypothetical protein